MDRYSECEMTKIVRSEFKRGKKIQKQEDFLMFEKLIDNLKKEIKNWIRFHTPDCINKNCSIKDDLLREVRELNLALAKEK